MRAIMLVPALFLAMSSVLNAQQNANTPPQPVDNEQVVNYWTTEGGWHSELQLRNNQAALPLTVKLAARGSDGEEIDIPAVTIKPQEVVSLNLHDLLATSAPSLMGKYGSLSLKYRSEAAHNLYAAIMIHDEARPIAFHVDATEPMASEISSTREGIWWLPKETTKDYLIFTNQGSLPMPVIVTVSDASGATSTRKQLDLKPKQTQRLAVRDLLTEGHISGTYGGILVRAVNHSNRLDTLHVIFDEPAGFSALLKMFDKKNGATLASRDFAKSGVWTLRAPMLALSNPDPALQFPAGTNLQPRLFLRNTTNHTIDAKLAFNWRTDNAVGSTPSERLKLGPREIRMVDVSKLGLDFGIPETAHWANVKLTTALPGEIMAVAASYDSTLKYGAQTPFSDQLSHHWAGGKWEVDSLHDSIVTVGNGGASPTRARFILYYEHGYKKYELEQGLSEGEQMWVDVGNLIRNHVPDKNGQTLPSDLTEGSYEFQDIDHTAIGQLFEGKVIYDKTFGHVSYGCATCCGYRGSTLFYSPLGLAINFSSGDGVWGHDTCDGRLYDVTYASSGHWSVDNTAIATVVGMGSHTGHGVGATTSRTSVALESAGNRECQIVTWLPTGPTQGVSVSVTSANLWNNQIGVSLASSSGLTGTLTISLVGASSTYTFQYGSGAVGAGNYTATMNRPAIPADTYSSIKATWNVSVQTGSTGNGTPPSGSLGIKWKVLGLIRHSQYNTPAESTCTGAQSSAWIISLPSCAFTPITLKSDFISQTYINGTGVSSSHGIMKYTPGNKNQCAYPSGSNDSNTFLQVSSITGSCNKALDTSSVATNPNPVTDITTFGCGDNLSLITSTNTQQALKFPEDFCPACSGQFNGTNGHIDNYTHNTSCSGHLVGDYGNFWTADTYATD